MVIAIPAFPGEGISVLKPQNEIAASMHPHLLAKTVGI